MELIFCPDLRGGRRSHLALSASAVVPNARRRYRTVPRLFVDLLGGSWTVHLARTGRCSGAHRSAPLTHTAQNRFSSARHTFLPIPSDAASRLLLSRGGFVLGVFAPAAGTWRKPRRCAYISHTAKKEEIPACRRLPACSIKTRTYSEGVPELQRRKERRFDHVSSRHRCGNCRGLVDRRGAPRRAGRSGCSCP